MGDPAATADIRALIARNLCYLHAQRGGTWQTLAQTLAVGERVVAYWRSPNGPGPNPANVARLAEHFQVPVEFFYADNPESRDA